MLVFQGSLLSDAADIFEELGMRNTWERHLERTLGGPNQRIGAVAVWENAKAHTGTPRIDVPAVELDEWMTQRAEAVAHTRSEHGTLTAHKGRSVHQSRH